jgi:hypothetical protein
MRKLFFCILILMAWLNNFGQKTVLYDSSIIHARAYDANKINSYKNDPVFQYDRIIESPKSLWERFWSWVWSLIGRLFGTKSGGAILEWTIIALAIAILVFFILKLTGMTNAGLFGKNNKGEKLSYSTMSEDIHSIDFNIEIQKAIDEKNFRLAVRLLYLQSLKKLTDNGNISWKINKTNLAYWQELGGTKFQQPFFEITRQFENNWYGNRHANENEFATLKQTFSDFNSQLN